MQAPPAPGAGDKIDLNEVNGSLLYITVGEVVRDIDTKFGKSDAVRATVAILDGTKKGTVLEDVLLFPRVLRQQLEGFAGKPDPVVVGRLGQGEARNGNSQPWMINDPTDADLAVGAKYEAYAAKLAEEQEAPW